jgi:hypothetical protein
VLLQCMYILTMTFCIPSSNKSITWVVLKGSHNINVIFFLDLLHMLILQLLIYKIIREPSPSKMSIDNWFAFCFSFEYRITRLIFLGMYIHTKVQTRQKCICPDVCLTATKSMYVDKPIGSYCS